MYMQVDLVNTSYLEQITDAVGTNAVNIKKNRIRIDHIESQVEASQNFKIGTVIFLSSALIGYAAPLLTNAPWIQVATGVCCIAAAAGIFLIGKSFFVNTSSSANLPVTQRVEDCFKQPAPTQQPVPIQQPSVSAKEAAPSAHSYPLPVKVAPEPLRRLPEQDQIVDKKNISMGVMIAGTGMMAASILVAPLAIPLVTVGGICAIWGGVSRHQALERENEHKRHACLDIRKPGDESSCSIQ